MVQRGPMTICASCCGGARSVYAPRSKNMARYETYQSNEAEAPVMRKWLICAFFLSLALHAGLIVAFRMKTLDRFGNNDAPRLAPPTEILTRVKIPQMPDEDTHAVLHSGASKASKYVIPDEKPVVEDIKIQAPIPDFVKSITQDKPKAEAQFEGSDGASGSRPVMAPWRRS